MIDQVQCIGKDPALLAETLQETRTRTQARIDELETEKQILERDLSRHNAELRKLAGCLATNGAATDRVADLQDRIRAVEQQSTQVREELIGLGRELFDESEAARAMALFDPVWDALTPREQQRVISLLVQRVDYDGAKGIVSVTFYPSGIKILSRELQEASAFANAWSGPLLPCQTGESSGRCGKNSKARQIFRPARPIKLPEHLSRAPWARKVEDHEQAEGLTFSSPSNDARRPVRSKIASSAPKKGPVHYHQWSAQL